MLYIIYGVQSVMIKNRIKKIVEEKLDFVDELNYVKFSMPDVLIQDVVDEANYLPLGYDHKIIVLENATFLTNTRKRNKGEDKNDYASLISYLKNPNEDTDLILTLNSDTIDEKSDYYKLIKDKGKIFQLLGVSKEQWDTYIYRYFNESLHVRIDKDAITELKERINDDLNLFVNEAAKLALYTDHVTYEDVCLLVNKPLDENSYQIFNYLLDNKNGEAVQLFRDLQVESVEPVTLVSMLANQFRLLYQVIFLSKSGMQVEEVAKELKIKDVRVKIMKRYMYRITLEQILNTLDSLYELDYNIKSGQVDRFLAFELFLIKFNLN